MSLTGTDDFDGVTGIPQDVVETVVQRATATAAATDTTTGSAATSTATDFSSQLIKQTESHWSVSGTSVIAAWLACLAGGIMIILLFSYLRTKHEMIFLPRYRHLVRQETKNIVSRHQNNYHSLIPSSNPKADLETPEWETVIVEGEKKYRIKRAELDVPFWGWLRPAWHDFKVELKLWDKSGAKKKRDERILKTLGLDAYTMLEFLRLFRWLFALISIFVAIPLLCANYFINTQTEYGSTSLSLAEGSETTGVSFNNMTSVIGDLQLYTAANIKGDGLWVHVMAEWAVTLLVLLQVRIYAARHERAIESWSDMNRNEVSFKTIMLTRFEITKDIPIPTAKARIRGWLKLTKDERKLLIDLKQENMGPFYEKFEFWNETEHRRAGAAVQRIIDRQKRLAGVDQGVDDYGELQEGNDMRKQDEDEGLDVQGGCAWWNMDALKSDYHILREGIGVFTSASESQAELREQEAGGRLVADVTAAFVTWSTARDAHTVLQRLLKDKDFRFKVERAPRNNCVIWRNLEKDPATLTAHRITGQILRLIITVVNSLPLLFITVLANLDALTRRWPRLQTLRDSSKFWEAVFTAAAGILPAGLAALFVLALPHLMRFLSHWQGALSRGQMDQDVIKQMFVFMLISKFVIFSLLGIGYETYLTVVDKIGNLTFTEIVESLGDVPAKVTKAYISQSSYWLSFFPIRSALTCLNLLQPARWVMKFWEIYIKREANTRDRWDEVGEPSDFEYAIEYTDLLFGMVVALVYTPLAPLIALCGTLYFWIASVVVQNQLTFVEKTVETDGKAWRVVMNRVLAGLACMQGLMILTVLLKTNPFATDTSSPLGVRLAPLIVSIFPLGVTFHLVQHVRTKKSAAEIITSSSSLLSSSSLSEEERQTALARLAKIRSLERKAKEGEVPKFEHEILNTDALKHINIFPSDLTYLVDGLEKARGGMTLKDGKIQAGWSKRVFWDARALIPQYGAYMAELEKTAEQRKAEEDAKRKKEEAERRREERKKREKEARERERKKREKRRKEEREAEERWRADEKRRREEREKKRLKEEERFREREKLKRELKQLKEQSEKKGRK